MPYVLKLGQSCELPGENVGAFDVPSFRNFGPFWIWLNHPEIFSHLSINLVLLRLISAHWIFKPCDCNCHVGIHRTRCPKLCLGSVNPKSDVRTSSQPRLKASQNPEAMMWYQEPPYRVRENTKSCEYMVKGCLQGVFLFRIVYLLHGSSRVHKFWVWWPLLLKTFVSSRSKLSTLLQVPSRMDAWTIGMARDWSCTARPSWASLDWALRKLEATNFESDVWCTFLQTTPQGCVLAIFHQMPQGDTASRWSRKASLQQIPLERCTLHTHRSSIYRRIANAYHMRMYRMNFNGIRMYTV